MRVAGKDAAVARVAGSYCRYAIPDLAAADVLPARVYLQSKGKPRRLTSVACRLCGPLQATTRCCHGHRRPTQ
uniref:Uncharacterized protein n=1 Tax=Oryza brachyantha TaxID=4533 RepID=J3N1U5_ORYBR